MLQVCKCAFDKACILHLGVALSYGATHTNVLAYLRELVDLARIRMLAHRQMHATPDRPIRVHE